MSFFIVNVPPRVSVFDYNFCARKIGGQHSVCCWKGLCILTCSFGHDILLSFESAVFYDTQNVSDRC